jgi:hypothetical protein
VQQQHHRPVEVGVSVAPVSQDISRHLASIHAGGEGIKVFASAAAAAAGSSGAADGPTAGAARAGDAPVQPPPTLARKFISKVRNLRLLDDVDANMTYKPYVYLHNEISR